MGKIKGQEDSRNQEIKEYERMIKELTVLEPNELFSLIIDEEDILAVNVVLKNKEAEKNLGMQTYIQRLESLARLSERVLHSMILSEEDIDVIKQVLDYKRGKVRLPILYKTYANTKHL